MKKNLILFLKIVILLIAAVAFIWMLKFPQLEGRAANLSLISIYTDPLIIYGFIASVPFFVLIYQSLKLLNLIDKSKVFSQSAVNALRKIRLACLSLIAFILLGMLYIRFFTHGDDPAGPTMLGIFASFVATSIAAAAFFLQKHLQERLEN